MPGSKGRAVQWWGVLLLALGVAGCAPLAPEAEREAAYEAFLAERAGLDEWSVGGRAALRAEGEAAAFSLRWRQRGEAYTIRLTGPFGAGGVEIRGEPGAVALTGASGRTMAAETPEGLLAEATGHRLPMTALRDWIVGRPATGMAVETLRLDGEGRPERIEQAGWELAFHGWSEVDGVDLPGRIDLHSGERQLRVALSGWSLGDGE